MFFIYTLQSTYGQHADTLRASALRIAIVAALLTVIQHVLGPARLAASFSGVFDGSLQDFYLHSDAGIAHGVRLTGMLVIIVGLALRNQLIAMVGGFLACLSFVMMGHTVTHSPRWILALLVAVHVSVVAFWFGSLRPLRRFADVSPTEYALLLDQFSRIAGRAVPIIFVAGLGLSVLLLESFSKLATPYGFMIIGKISGFALLIAMASFNRWRLLPGIRQGDMRAIATFRNIAVIEWLVIVAIIIATVLMTTLFSP